MNFKNYLNKKYLTELFDKPLRYHWENNKTAEFVINDKNYSIEFSIFENSKGLREADVHFNLRDDADVARIDLTNTGDEIKVFSTILQIINEFIKNNNVDVLTFSAEEPSRINLYKRIANKFSKHVKTFEREWGVEFWVYLK